MISNIAIMQNARSKTKPSSSLSLLLYLNTDEADIYKLPKIIIIYKNLFMFVIDIIGMKIKISEGNYLFRLQIHYHKVKYNFTPYKKSIKLHKFNRSN